MAGNYPNTFYRVAVKALIKDSKGQILLIKEKSDKWDLPGGGLNHGEEPEDGIKREIQEEIGLTDGIHVGEIVGQKSFWLEDKQSYLMWIVYAVTIPSQSTFQLGEGVTAVEYINSRTLQRCSDERERYLAAFSE